MIREFSLDSDCTPPPLLNPAEHLDRAAAWHCHESQVP